jgi:hypothetical protein
MVHGNNGDSVCSLPMRNKVAFKKVFDIGVILPVILQPAKNLMIFQIKKSKKKSFGLQPQDDTEKVSLQEF